MDNSKAMWGCISEANSIDTSGVTEYLEEDEKVPLPLGHYFQRHVGAFIKKTLQRNQIDIEYSAALKLIDNLQWVALSHCLNIKWGIEW